MLAKEGSIGCEKVSDILNDNFTKMINVIVSHSGWQLIFRNFSYNLGDVFKFAGDAIIALFWIREDYQTMEQICLTALKCGYPIAIFNN